MSPIAPLQHLARHSVSMISHVLRAAVSVPAAAGLAFCVGQPGGSTVMRLSDYVSLGITDSQYRAHRPRQPAPDQHRYQNHDDADTRGN